jgi:hypothetical protein
VLPCVELTPAARPGPDRGTTARTLYDGGVVIAFAVLLTLLALAGLAVVVLNLLGLDPAWLAQSRHALAEARQRTAGVLAEFGDWLRLGR